MTSIATNNDEQEQATYTFYKKYLWKQIAADYVESGQILRTIYCQFGNWCVEKGFSFGDDDFTKLFWFKRIVPFLCYEDPCTKVLRGHTASVFSLMKLNETTIVSGSRDNTLRVWDLTNDTSRVLRGHTDYVLSVMKLNKTTIVSGSCDKTLRVWDLTNDTSRELRGHTSGVNSVIKLNETTIVSGSYRTLRVWDLAKPF